MLPKCLILQQLFIQLDCELNVFMNCVGMKNIFLVIHVDTTASVTVICLDFLVRTLAAFSGPVFSLCFQIDPRFDSNVLKTICADETAGNTRNAVVHMSGQ